jgi:hypothetical protein
MKKIENHKSSNQICKQDKIYSSCTKFPLNSFKLLAILAPYSVRIQRVGTVDGQIKLGQK